MTRPGDDTRSLPTPPTLEPSQAESPDGGGPEDLAALMAADPELAAVLHHATAGYKNGPVPTAAVPKRGGRADDRGAPLSARQQNAIELLVLGHTDATVAEKVKVHRVTVTKWRLYHLAFQAELNRRRQEVWGGGADRLRGLLRHAVRVFRRQIGSEDVDVSFRAAKTLLDYAANGKFAPPPEPTDPLGVLDAHARQTRRERFASNPADAALEDEDRLLAMHDLVQRGRSHREEHSDDTVE